MWKEIVQEQRSPDCAHSPLLRLHTHVCGQSSVRPNVYVASFLLFPYKSPKNYGRIGYLFAGTRVRHKKVSEQFKMDKFTKLQPNCWLVDANFLQVHDSITMLCVGILYRYLSRGSKRAMALSSFSYARKFHATSPHKSS